MPETKNEDIRFKNAVIYLLRNGNIVYGMLKYISRKYRTSEQLEHIKQMLMAVNIHIAASSLTNAGFALATASFVAAGMNLSLELSALAGRRAGGVVGAYWHIQCSPESSR
jgi:hypothetical protein